MSKMQLIFVYNADGGIFDRIMDAAHKLFAPTTYQCSLCAITYGAVSMHREWKDYMVKLPFETRFYHRDGFHREWPRQNITLPAILMLQEDRSLRMLVTSDELNQQSSIAQLTALLGRKLAEKT